MPLGIFKTTVKKVEQTGLYIVLRPMNVPHATREDIDQFLVWLIHRERLVPYFSKEKKHLVTRHNWNICWADSKSAIYLSF